MSDGSRRALLWIVWAVEWLAVAALAAVCFALDITVEESGNNSIFLQGLVEWVHSYPTALGIGLFAVLVAARGSKLFLRNDCVQKQTIDRLITAELDRFRVKVFPGIPLAEPKDHNRVTVFRHINCKWWIWPFRGWITPWGGLRGPSSGWLVIACRSGHLTQRGGTLFLAPDDATHAEGVAGMGWRGAEKRVGTGQTKLPDLNHAAYIGRLRRAWFFFRRLVGWNDMNVGAYQKLCDDISTYAQLTATSTESIWSRLRCRKKTPTSILAVALPDHRSQPWGVLVMDSCNVFECIDTKDPIFRTALRELCRKLTAYGVFDGQGV